MVRGVKIGKGVRIAAHCTIVPSNHIYTNPNEFIYKQGLSRLGIIIEDDVWIGSGLRVLDGVTIRKGCVIGANAVIVGKITVGSDVLIAPNAFVNRDIPDHSIVYGNPCIIKPVQYATEHYINRIV